MKIGIISDLHREFDGDLNPWDFKPEPDVTYLCAGDIDSARSRRMSFIKDHEAHMFAISGNHDFYGHQLTTGNKIETTVKGFTLAAATLWTDLSDPKDWFNYIQGLVDSRFIEDLTYEHYNEIHREHKKFLLESGADIIMSHHAPSKQSTAPEFIGDKYNPCFVNDLNQEILALKNPPKLWICGHVHHKHDYWIGNTHVICNPRGYRHESNYKNYQPQIVEI